MSLMECAISVKNCTPCWKWSSLCLMACSPVNTVKARSSPCWICWMSWCHLPLRHCRGSFKCLRSRFVWLCLKPCCLLDDLMRYKSKPRESWDRRRSLCWRGHGCVGPCLVQPASTCCKALALLGEQSPLAFWLPGIRPSAPVVRWKIGIALSGLIWPFIANSRLVCSPCSPFGIITGLLLVVSTQVFLPYNGRNLTRPLTIGWLLWVILLSLPDCSKVSHGFEPCLKHGLPPTQLWFSQVEPNIMREIIRVPPHETITLVEDGQEIELAGEHYRVIWTPGHSDGHICLFRERDGIFLAADHVLPRITPNVGLYSQYNRPNPRRDSLASLRKVAPLPATLVLPGHGEPFENLAGRVEEIIAHHREREAQILAMLEQRPQHAYQLSEQLFGARLKSNEAKRMAVAEVLSHLEYMRYNGKVEQERTGEGLILYKPV